MRPAHNFAFNQTPAMNFSLRSNRSLDANKPGGNQGDAQQTAAQEPELERLLKYAAGISEVEGARLKESLASLQLVRGPLPRIAIKVKGRILFIDLADVVSVQAEGNYVRLQREASSFLLRESISVLAEKLEAYGFIRIHRSVLVRSSFVEEIRPHSTGEYGLRVKGGKEYTVTRTYKRNLQSLAEFWIGSHPFFPDRERRPHLRSETAE